jgi:hypothetical protein
LNVLAAPGTFKDILGSLKSERRGRRSISKESQDGQELEFP